MGEDADEAFDFERLKEVAGFVLRSPRRHPFLAAGIFVAVASLGLAIAVTIPRQYTAQVRLLVQHNLVLHTLSNPTQARQAEQQPNRDVGNLIMEHDNLVSLVKEANLIDRFYSTRAPALRLKDRLMELISGPPTSAERLRSIVGMLEKRLIVGSDDSSVTISISWNDPQVAYEIATLVQKHFVEARYDAEVAMIQDAIGVLEDHAKTELEQVDSSLADYEKLRAERLGSEQAVTLATAPAAPAPAPRAPVRTPTVAAAAVAADSTVTKALEDKRREIRALEDERQRERDNLKQQLSQAQLTLAPMHPTVLALQEQLAGLSQPSPELEREKKEERALMAEVAADPSPAASAGPAAPVAAPPPAAAARSEARATTLREDPALAPSRERLDAAIRRYQDVMARIDAAKLELDISRTAFRYRYSVITPAEVPRGPNKPLGTIIGGASLIGAVIAALLAATAADMLRGRILEPWQVKRHFNIEVLGEFEPPP